MAIFTEDYETFFDVFFKASCPSYFLSLQACEKKQWSLVRHTAGLLQKRVEDLAEVSKSLMTVKQRLFSTTISSTSLLLLGCNRSSCAREATHGWTAKGYHRASY